MKESEDGEVIHPIIEEAADFVQETDKRIENDPQFAYTTYGHAAGNLAFALNVNSWAEDPEEAARAQREVLLRKTKELLEQFGPGIIEFLRDELKLIVKEENL